MCPSSWILEEFFCLMLEQIAAVSLLYFLPSKTLLSRSGAALIFSSISCVCLSIGWMQTSHPRSLCWRVAATARSANKKISQLYLTFITCWISWWRCFAAGGFSFRHEFCAHTVWLVMTNASDIACQSAEVTSLFALKTSLRSRMSRSLYTKNILICNPNHYFFSTLIPLWKGSGR